MNTTTPSANPLVEILIAEDSPTQAQRLRHILEQRGYRVTHTANGRLALEAAQRHKPTIIISDVLMPEMDGYELCRRVKADASLGDIPVILVTTLSDPGDVIRGLECRADNFILKPYDEHYLLGRVQFVLLNREMLQAERATMGVEIYFNGQRHSITADRLQILNLLLSTYDAAIQRTKELIRSQEELLGSNRLLGETNLRLEQASGEREKVEQALRASEENLAVTLQSIGDAVLATDAAGRVTRLNAVAETLTGWTQAEAAGRPVEEIFRIINGVNRQPAFLPVTDTLAKGTIHGLANHTVLIARDGTERPIADSCAPIRNREGAVIGAVLVFRDVTEQYRASAQLARNIKALAEFKAALDEHAIVAITDPRGKITYVNDKFCAISKYAREELLGQDHRIVNSGHHPKAFMRELWETITSGRVWKGAIKDRAKDGSFYWGDTTIVPFLGDDGKPIQFIAIRADISERQQAEQDLRESEDRLQEMNKNLERLVTERTGELIESEARFRQLAEHIDEVFWMTDVAKSQMIYISPAYEKVWGRTCAALYASPGAWLDAIHPEDRERIVQSTLTNQTTAAYDEEYRINRPDGTIRWIHDRAFPVRNQPGEIYRIAGVAIDMTERKRAEMALLNSEARLEEAQRIAHVGSWEWEAATDTPTWSKELCAILEVDPAKPVPSLSEQHKIYTPESIKKMQAALEQAMRTGTSYEIELERIRADGTSRWLLARGEPLFNEQRQITGLRGTALDITERRQHEDQLRLFRTLLNQSTDAILVADPATARIVDVNDSACTSLGYTREELLALRVMDIEANLTDVAAYERTMQQLKTAGAMRFEGRQRRKDGSIFPVEVSVRYITRPEGDYMLAIARDITERKNMERVALRSQRLESIGTLAAGVAHDLNNALAPILLGVELIKEQYPQESQIAGMFQTSARRGADMVRHLLAFAKGAEGERVILQPGHLVRELEKLMKGSFPKNLQLAVQCDPKLPKVLGDATQLHQMLMNLCVNARDAMPHGGTLTLEAQSMEVDAIYASSLLDGKPGKYVVLRVRDTGTGIPPEIIDRIFDPFFTTKGPDKGTGLGLSTVIGIVKGHGGFLQVDSQPGQGSTFAVYLPAADAGNDTEHVTKAVAGFRGQGETILIVEDDDSVRKVGCAVLRRLNFNPLAATDGADGLIRAAENRTELRAVITDLHMPHMDGLAFVRALRRMLPDIPVAVTSGRMEDAVAAEFKTLGVTTRLDKPFTEAQLAEALENLLAPK